VLFVAIAYSPAVIAQTNYSQAGVIGKTAIWIDDRFTQGERGALGFMIWQLKRGLFNIGYGEERLAGPASSCIVDYSNASNTKARLDEFSRAINEQRMLTPQHWTQRRLYINRYFNNSNDELGNAYLGRGSFVVEDFVINLNAAKFQRIASFSGRQLIEALRGGAGSDTLNTFAGVILHEMLHNLGHSHPDVSISNMNPAIGNFVYEAGWCVARNGAPKTPGTLGLTGSGPSSGFFID